jgi:hypothetical protein
MWTKISKGRQGLMFAQINNRHPGRIPAAAETLCAFSREGVPARFIDPPARRHQE